LVFTESTKLKARGAYITCREQQQLIYFLTALCSDFKRLRGSILHCSPFSSTDLVHNELLVDEVHL
jgi:hypothetical protein